MSKPPIAPQKAQSPEELLRRGLQLHQSGRADEARPFYERVLGKDPKHPAANHLLGLVLLGKGEAAKAVDHISRAVASRPDDAQYLGNLGVALNAAGRHGDAIGVLQRATALKPDFAEAWSNLGMAYRELRRFDAATDSYRHAIRIRPAEAGFHYNLGNALVSAGDIIPAEAAYREALRLRPGHPSAAGALARLLDEEGRYEAGLAVIDDALRRSQGDAKLHMRRGRLLHHSGRLAESLEAFDRTLQLEPGLGEAHLHRAALRRHDPADPAIAAMERIYSADSASAEDRVAAGFGLAKALADIGEHDASVETYLGANRLQRLSAPFSLQNAVEGLRSDLDRVVQPVDPGPTGRREAGPIFVVGLPRAGKSTVEAILSQHPEAVPVRELPTLGRLYERMLQAHPGVALASVPPARLEELGRSYLEEASAVAGSARITVDTMPSNYRLVGLIRAALPHARVIWCQRSPVEHRVAILEKHIPGYGHEYATDPDDLAVFHAAYVEAMNAWERQLPGFVHWLDVADLRSDRRTQTGRLLEFCGLDWNENCLGDLESEPQIGDWGGDRVAANRAAQLAAWRAKRPDLFVERY